MPPKVSDPVQFFPFDPVSKTIILTNPPLEGTVANVLSRYYRIDLPGLASCMVSKSNPTLARCGPEGDEAIAAPASL